MWIFGGFKGAERVYVECTAGCPNEAARKTHWVPPANFVAGSWRRRWRRVVAAAGRGGGAAALARFPAVRVRQRLGADGINVSLLRDLRVRAHGRCRPLCAHRTTGRRRRVAAAAHRRPSQSVLRAEV